MAGQGLFCWVGEKIIRRARGGGDWQKASIERRSDLQPVRVFYRVHPFAGRPGPARPGQLSYRASIKHRSNTDRFMVVSFQSTKSSSVDFRLGRLTVTALNARCCQLWPSPESAACTSVHCVCVATNSDAFWCDFSVSSLSTQSPTPLGRFACTQCAHAACCYRCRT